MARYRPPLKTLVYGESGSWKSSFAKTFPKPLLVFMSDAPGKDSPYMKDWNNKFLPEESVGPLLTWDLGNNLIVPYRDIMHSDGPIRIEYYQELENVREPRANKTFHSRLSIFHREYANYATVCVDSLTAFEFNMRKQYEYELLANTGKEAKYDQRHWYGGSTHDMEELLMGRFPGLPMNVVVISHIHLKETGELGGELVRLLSLPGQLKKTAPRSYMEYYHAYVGMDPEFKVDTGLLQTRTGFVEGGMQRFYCATQINAPNPVRPYYPLLWNKEDFGE